MGQGPRKIAKSALRLAGGVLLSQRTTSTRNASHTAHTCVRGSYFYNTTNWEKGQEIGVKLPVLYPRIHHICGLWTLSSGIALHSLCYMGRNKQKKE